MKKLSLILLSVIILLTGSCNTWMQDDNFYSDIENDVKVANAKQISVYVRYAMTRQGKTDPDGSATFKVEIPHEISATTEPEYGFVRWAAFPTSYLATGDNQSKNKDIYFIDEDDYNERILPNEIQSPQVVFEDATKPNTSVKINVERNDIYLCPIVAQRPVVSLTIPAKGSSGVVRNMTVRINFSKPMDPESFKNEAGVYDKITVTQGIQSFSADGDIEVSSEDITNRFREPEFSANGKMVTLKFTEEAISEGYASQSSVNITISKDVKDIYGFSMADDDKISFSVGSSMDTLAPRITQLTAGTAMNNFHQFKGMYKDAETWNAIQAYTKMDSHLHGSTYLGSADAPTNNIDNAFFDTFAPADTPENANNEGYRVTNKVYIRVFAEDIAGSGSNQDQTGIESDVTSIGIRATPMYYADGTPYTDNKNLFHSYNYMPQANMTGEPGVYKELIQTVNGFISGTDNDFAEDKGCLYSFNLNEKTSDFPNGLPDGLIRIDVAAIDMVQNYGFSDGGAYSREYGNAYATLFVVKDTTPPDAAANAGAIVPDVSHATPTDHYFNNNPQSTHYKNFIEINGDTNSFVDSGVPRLRSKHDKMKWVVRLTSDTTWKNSASGWKLVTEEWTNFTPTAEGPIPFTFALMDDLGNISEVETITPSNPVFYDSVAPAFQNLSFVADEGNTAGVASSNILNTQTLIIPIFETTSGLKKIEVNISKDGTEPYTNPFDNTNLIVTIDGLVVDSAAYSISGKTITLGSARVNFNSTVTIKGLKLSDTTQEGNYTISATVTDAADNATTSPATVINIDSVAPVVNKIYIPSIYKAIKTNNTASAEYWMSYNHSIDATGVIPTTDVYLTFTEATSGAKIFDFGSSSIHLTDASTICTVDSTTLAPITAISATVNSAANTLTINSSEVAGRLLKGSTSVMVKITNVQLAVTGTGAPADSTVNIKIHDTATNVSDAKTIISRHATSDSADYKITSFKYDPYAPVTAQPTLTDRAIEEGHIAAEAGYTSEVYVNASVTITPTISGINAITIDGDAVFDSTTTMTSSTDTTALNFDISDSGKTATFYRLSDPANTNSTHLPAVISSSSAVTINISDLLLTSGDGTKSVAIRARSFNDVTGANSTARSIILDTVTPTWVSGALYTSNTSNTAKVYPHPISGGKAYGFTGVDTANSDVIYFYRNAALTISPDISDTNLKADSGLIAYTQGTTTTYSRSFTTSGSGPFTATARDKAGNLSATKTFQVVVDSDFADNTANINNYITLSKPDGGKVWHNPADGTNVSYIIRGKSNGTADTDYKIIVKLASGVTTSDEKIDGTHPTAAVPPYNRILKTTTSSPIEYFGVTIGNTTPASWHLYQHAASNYSDSYSGVSIRSNVDSNGNIEITIPNIDCSYISLHLKDACGNTTAIPVKDLASTPNYVLWTIDNILGAGEEEYKGTPVFNALPAIVRGDTTFYNTTLTLDINNCSDSVRFGSNHSSSTPTDYSEDYTMRARIITWNGSSAPTQTNFYQNDFTNHTPQTTASDWVGWKEANAGVLPSTEFHLTGITVPQPDTETPYQLWYILEDAVGNCRIEQLKKQSTVSNWLYDNIAPEVQTTNLTGANINTLNFNSSGDISSSGTTRKNYYSNLSFVNYTVDDSKSGIKNDGQTAYTLSTFLNRKQNSNVKYLLENASLSGNYIPIAGIEDNAGNSRPSHYLSYTSDNGSATNIWVKQTAKPTWSTSSSSVTVKDETKSTTEEKSYKIAKNFTSTSSEDSLTITSTKAHNSLDIKLSITSLDASNNPTPVLGLLVTNSTLSDTEKNAFISKNDSRLILTSIDDSTNFVNTGTPTALSIEQGNSGHSYRYRLTKGSNELWHEKYPASAPLYIYPVSRSGLICDKPLKISFNTNPVPSISGVSDTNPTLGTSYFTNVPTYGSGDSARNFLKYTDESKRSKLIFTTVNAPTSYTLKYGSGSSQSTGNLASGNNQTFILAGTSAMQGIENASLKLVLSTTYEDSVEYILKGPADNNSWTFDETAPAVTFTASDIYSNKSTPVVAKSSSDSTDTTKYIENEQAKIVLTLKESASSSTAASDIAQYQWKKTGDTDWSTIPSTAITESTGTATVIFDAPVSKTLYEFRVIDKAGNISAGLDFSTSSSAKYNKVTLQRDEWKPAGELAYTLWNNTINKTSSFVGTTLIIPDNTDTDNPKETIKYSPNSSSDLRLTKINIDFSNINDKYDDIERSGIENFYLRDVTAGTTANAITLDSSKIHSLDLPTSGSKTYEVSVKDNIGNTRILKTFTFEADDTEPALSLAESNPVKTYSQADASDIENVTYKVTGSPDKYYIKGAHTQITFAIDDTLAVYKWKQGAGSYEAIPAENKSFAKSDPTLAHEDLMIVTFDTPADPTEYSFQAIDGVLNPSVEVTFKIAKDYDNPDGTFGYELKGTSTDISANFKDDADTSTGTANDDFRIIKYKAGTVTQLDIDFSNLTDADSGIEKYYVKVDSTEPVGFAPDSTSLTSAKHYLITLADAGAVTTTYTFSVKDNVGHERILKTIRLTSDAEAPDFALDTTTPVQAVTGENAGSIYQDGTSPYYIKGSHAKINFTKSHPDIASYWMQAGTADPVQLTSETEGFSISDTAVTYQFAAPTAETTYKFYAIDNVGNQSSEQTVTLVQDVTAPALAETQSLTFRILNSSDTDATAVSDTVPSADYVLSTEGTTTTITYNPAVVKKIVFDDLSAKFAEYATSGANSGFDRLYYQSSSGDPHDMDSDNDGVNQIGFSSSWTTKTYSIYASDKAGNKSAALMTFELIADNTAPKLANDDRSKVVPHNGVNKIIGYTSTIGTIPYANVPKIGDYQKANYFPSGTQIMYPKTDLPDAVQYKIVQTVTTAEADGYNASANNDTYSWQSMTEDAEGNNYVFTLPDITVKHTRLAFFFRDKVGNVSSTYYLGNNGSAENDYGVQWWITSSAELNASNVRISNVVASGTTTSGWQDVKKNYLVSINLPIGAVISSVTLSPAANGQNTGFVWTTASGTKDQIQFTGFPSANGEVTSISTPTINITDSSSAGLTLKVYVWDKKAATDSTTTMTKDDCKVIINGTIELPVFPDGGYGSFTSSGDSFITGGITSAGGRKAQDSDSGAQASGDSRDSRVTQFFNNLSNTFVSKPEVSTDTSVSEKPVTTAKKTAKKAAKKAKQTANATQKASPVTAPVAVAETAEIITPNVISEVVETSVTAPEAKVNVAESSVVEAQISASSTVEPASEPAKKRVPSKSASIVIMLSIICSIGVVLYLNKSRKK